MKRILVLEEKHGNRYFDASTDKLLAQASLIVLKERYEEGGWYFKPSEPSKPDFTEEQASELPPSLKPAAMEFLRLYNCQLLRRTGRLRANRTGHRIEQRLAGVECVT